MQAQGRLIGGSERPSRPSRRCLRPGGAPASGATFTSTYNHIGADQSNGAEQTFLVPSGVTTVSIVVTGASGGSVAAPGAAGGTAATVPARSQ